MSLCQFRMVPNDEAVRVVDGFDTDAALVKVDTEG